MKENVYLMFILLVKQVREGIRGLPGALSTATGQVRFTPLILVIIVLIFDGHYRIRFQPRVTCIACHQGRWIFLPQK